MNSQTATPITNSNSVPLHCQHRTASGRRCRMAVSDPDSGLCPKHAADRQKELDQADLAAALVGDIQEFRDALTINHSLGELYKLQARNKITPRRAAVMAYTCNLLLRTLPAIARDNLLQPEQPGPMFDFSDWPNSVRGFVPGVSPLPDPSQPSRNPGPAAVRNASGVIRDQEKTPS